MLKILIADDERFERELLGDIVSKCMGHEAEVRLAENGRQTVEIASIWGADLILLDIEMPGVNGIEAARQLKEQRPEIKIIFVTAYSLFSYAHEAVRLGASDYILKPVDAQDVEKAVRRVAAQAEAERQLAELARNGASQIETPDSNAETDSSEKVSLTMSKVKDYLQHNYMYDISLDSVSEILGMSPSYFSVMFKRSFGVGFVDYLNELRIQAAQELLDDPLRSTAEVASLVGYESANYFARIFKKKTGMTPTEYRRKGGNSR